MSKIKIFALGGLNENGKNMYVVEVNRSIFILDAGLKYADDKLLGVDYIIPNFDYIKQNLKNIKGIFITHGHDSQMGAIVDIVREIPDIDIYGTSFTIDMIKDELDSEKISTQKLHTIIPHHKLDFGKISVFPVTLTHSVPGAVGYSINTPDGTIFYTGNFVFDQTMPGPYKTDIGKLAYIGKQGVLCLMSESLYAEKKGYTAPNNRISSVIRDALDKADDRILIHITEAELYRIQEIFNEVSLTDRKIVILGKKLGTIIEKAINDKYLILDKRRLVSIRNIGNSDVVVLISDEREKPFSNISRIIRGVDKFVKINTKDTIIFASPVYEGMEKSTTKIYDSVAKLGANLITISSKKYLGHHASSEDLMTMINLMNPKYYFPVIGEYKDQVANSKCALKMGIKKENIILNLNGDVAYFNKGVLEEGQPKIKIDEILIDGKNLGDVGELVLKDRELLSESGIVIVSTTIDKFSKKIFAGPEVLTKGFIYVKDNVEIIEEARKICLEVIKENTKPRFIDFNKIKIGIRDKLGKYLYKETECKPMILVVMQEVERDNSKAKSLTA